MEEKNKISHRGKALELMKEQLRNKINKIICRIPFHKQNLASKLNQIDFLFLLHFLTRL